MSHRRPWAMETVNERSKHIFDLLLLFSAPPPKKKKLEWGGHFGAENKCVMRPRQLPTGGRFFPSK